MRLAPAVVLTLLLAACQAVSLPLPTVEPAPVGGTVVAFEVPEGWSRIAGVDVLHYFTTGDPAICEGVVGQCAPSTYVMERGTMDVSISELFPEPDAGIPGCVEEGRPTWANAVEERPSATRQATARRVWRVCFPGRAHGVLVAADLRAGTLELRDELLGQLEAFIATVQVAAPPDAPDGGGKP